MNVMFISQALLGWDLPLRGGKPWKSKKTTGPSAGDEPSAWRNINLIRVENMFRDRQMVLVGWVSFQLWLVSNKIIWLFRFLCLEFGGWVVWQGWTKRANNNILRWSKLPWMQLLFRLDDSYGLWDILPLIILLRSHWQQTLRFFIFWEIWGDI